MPAIEVQHKICGAQIRNVDGKIECDGKEEKFQLGKSQCRISTLWVGRGGQRPQMCFQDSTGGRCQDATKASQKWNTRGAMTNLLIGWLASAVALYVVTLVVPGVRVSSITATLIAAAVIGLVNTTIGNILKLLTLPIGCLTLGLSSLLINGLMFLLAANLVSGFRVDGYIAALLGSIVMSLVNWALFAVLKQDGSKSEK